MKLLKTQDELLLFAVTAIAVELAIITFILLLTMLIPAPTQLI